MSPYSPYLIWKLRKKQRRYVVFHTQKSHLFLIIQQYKKNKECPGHESLFVNNSNVMVYKLICIHRHYTSECNGPIMSKQTIHFLFFQGKSGLYDAIFFDVNTDDNSMAITGPPMAFLEDSVLESVKLLLSPSGIIFLIINLLIMMNAINNVFDRCFILLISFSIYVLKL